MPVGSSPQIRPRPQDLTHLCVLAAAGRIAFLGNELAQVRLRGGRRLSRAVLVADGNHARIDVGDSNANFRPRVLA